MEKTVNRIKLNNAHTQSKGRNWFPENSRGSQLTYVKYGKEGKSWKPIKI